VNNVCITRCEFVRLLGWGAAIAVLPGLCAWGQGGIAKKAPPNILMIMVDDLGYGDLGSYGACDVRTPHIDGLMQSGMRFDSFYANCPVCSPTRAALLSGCTPDRVGVPGVIRTHQANSWGYLKEGAELLPAVLKKAGYHTAIVGKWHLGLASPNTPNERGFDLFRGFLGDMMDDYWHHRRHDINYMYHNRQHIDPKGHATDLFTDWAQAYVRNRAGQKTPFFLYLAYNAPHTPIHPPAEWVEKVKQREKGINHKRAKLVAFIEHLDHGIGQVMQALKQTGQADNTLVVFTSDNGGQLNVGANNGPLRGGKQEMWEGGVKVPFCAVWPGKIKAGTRDSDTVAVTMDLYPTLCEAAGVSAIPEIEGTSLLSRLLAQDTDPLVRTLVWVRREGGHYGGRAYYAIRQGPWKLLQNTAFEPMRLYNLHDDPQEQRPLPFSHKMHKQLFRALQNHVNRSGAIPWAKAPVDIKKIYQGI
jgi:arylsulfatase A-like enzyme